MKLSLVKYVWRCVLGGEIVYAVCLLGGFLPLRSTQGMELHHALFETLPGFTWINFGSVILGTAYVLVFSVIYGCYMVWMFNASLEERNK
ncbi:MAG: hypothetical protein Q7S57_04885 [bacterium]|nr:hypothetical protein [bacterium]